MHYRDTSKMKSEQALIPALDVSMGLMGALGFLELGGGLAMTSRFGSVGRSGLLDSSGAVLEVCFGLIKRDSCNI